MIRIAVVSASKINTILTPIFSLPEFQQSDYEEVTLQCFCHFLEYALADLHTTGTFRMVPADHCAYLCVVYLANLVDPTTLYRVFTTLAESIYVDLVGLYNALIKEQVKLARIAVSNTLMAQGDYVFIFHPEELRG